MERLVARRTFPMIARTSACRSLFGPVDHEELGRELQMRLAELERRGPASLGLQLPAGHMPLRGPGACSGPRWTATPCPGSLSRDGAGVGRVACSWRLVPPARTARSGPPPGPPADESLDGPRGVPASPSSGPAVRRSRPRPRRLRRALSRRRSCRRAARSPRPSRRTQGFRAPRAGHCRRCHQHPPPAAPLLPPLPPPEAPRIKKLSASHLR